MKILHFLTSLEIGGAQRVRLNLIRELISIRPDLEHYLAYFQAGPMLQFFEQTCIKTVQIKGLFYKYDLMAYSQLYNFIKNNSIDLIHSALWASNFFTKILSANLRCPAILDLHCKHNLLSNRWHLEQLLNWLPEDKVERVAVSSAVASSYNYSNITIIHNGVNTQDFAFDLATGQQLRKELSIDPKTFVVGSIGRLEPEKNFSGLIEEFKNLQNTNLINKIVLLIIGDGSERERLLALIKKLQLEAHIKILPATMTIAKFYNAMDIVVLCSTTEGLPMVVLEALANGLPVFLPEGLRMEEVPGCIYFKIGSLIQAIKSMDKGFVETRDVCKLPEAFNLKEMSKKYLNTYLSLSANHGRPSH